MSILDYFHVGHLPEDLQEVARRFTELAVYLDAELPGGAEKSTALRKLLEGKDAAVRSALDLRAS